VIENINKLLDTDSRCFVAQRESLRILAVAGKSGIGD
jgi:hypothetical protein